MELQTYFNQKYQGSESFLQEVILPIFGADRFENGYNVDVLLGEESLKQLALASGVKSVLRVGQIDIPLNPIDIFDITVTDHIQMVRNRVSIQQLVRHIMNTFSGAFMIFHYESDEKWDWRFTFCNKLSSNEEVTESKRYTYLLGPNQACRTAAERFQNLAKKEGHVEIKDIINAFDVEALSKEFFDKYKAQYKRFVDYMTDESNGMRASFVDVAFDHTSLSAEQIRDKSEKPIRDYVKKLLGRIVFIYFLQKKGWMGIEPQKSWGEGDPDFLRNLFENASQEQKEDFLDEVLEPLFCQGFDTDRMADHDLYDTKVIGLPNRGMLKIPYLNGGLFERDELDIPVTRFPADYFKELFAFFGQYNFTIDENDPDDAQVGVDPEMLGRIFENLLEDNKDKGAFYTPKEIVQYMCRESLIAYLQTDIENADEKDAVRRFVVAHNAESLSDAMKSEIDRKLRDMKICDPAIGSGAFPMGLLKELFLCRGAIECFDNAAEIKKHIIQHNIYGVDTEKGAVDIARLRFWLSLIVDERTPHALPNMDFKIMQGNSLLESYEGIDLSEIANCASILQRHEPQYDIFGNIEKGQMETTFTHREEIKQLQEDISHFFQEFDHRKRERLRENIENSVRAQILYNVDLKMKQVVQQIMELSDIAHPTPKQAKALTKAEIQHQELLAIRREVETMKFPNDKFFLWHTYFSDVFQERGGFDIVIGNPPYIQLSNHGGFLAKMFQDERYETFARTGDIYCLFYEQGWKLLKSKGHLCYITSNKWMRAGYGEAIRKFFATKTNPIQLIDFAGVQIFDAATVDTNILLLQKAPNAYQTRACATKSADCRKNLSDYFRENQTNVEFRGGESWVILSPIEQSIKRKIEEIGTPLKDWDDFNKQKIIWKIIGNQMAFAIDSERYIVNNACYILTGTGLKYLLAVLNSKAIKWYSYITNMNKTGVGDVQVGGGKYKSFSDSLVGIL